MVLILVLLELSLWAAIVAAYEDSLRDGNVLILVLLELSLWGVKYDENTPRTDRVLILVLLELSLWEQKLQFID